MSGRTAALLLPLTPGVRLHLRTPQLPPASRECVPCLRSISTPRPVVRARCMRAEHGPTPPVPILASGAPASLSMTARCNHGRRAIRCRMCSRRSPPIQPAGRSWPMASSSTAPFTSTFWWRVTAFRPCRSTSSTARCRWRWRTPIQRNWPGCAPRWKSNTRRTAKAPY